MRSEMIRLGSGQNLLQTTIARVALHQSHFIVPFNNTLSFFHDLFLVNQRPRK